MEEPSLETYWLTSHPDTPGKAIKAISVKLSFHAPRQIGIWFSFYGKIAEIVWPSWAGSSRADGLWKTTCAEMFLSDPDGPGYCEFNISPSGEWAAYRFDDYRQGMRALDLLRFPDMNDGSRGADECLLAARITFETPGTTRLALSAVIEETDGTKSYWALAHPPGKPDFHAPTCFAATLPAPTEP